MEVWGVFITRCSFSSHSLNSGQMNQIVICMYRACRTIASACGSDNVFCCPNSHCAVARESHIQVSKDHTTGAKQ